jgi:hypothetical protein
VLNKLKMLDVTENTMLSCLTTSVKDPNVEKMTEMVRNE